VVEVEVRRVALALLEEDLVEAVLAHQLGRELVDRVAGGDDEDRRFAVLQPAEQAAEDPP